LVKIGFSLSLPFASSSPQTTTQIVYASKVAGIIGFAHLPWLAPDVIKTEVSTFHVHFIWLVLIFPLGPSQFEHLEPLVLLGDNVSR
jgi:hypothetical protein